MNVTLWIIATVLAVAFLAAGAIKLLQPKEKLAASGMGWAHNFSAATVKGIAVLEILAALGLVLTAVLGIAPVLVPLAALGLVMIGAAITHARRKESPMVIANVVLLILAAVVFWGRVGPYAFAS
ncbi:DoxX family protein [Arthrobacter sp. NPDC093128]|uniref:DoxX family protein n=1 Tax=Arthrobacter sp. NPDC093128 TaxID=3154979 RepID=UPI0034483C95